MSLPGRDDGSPVDSGLHPPARAVRHPGDRVLVIVPTYDEVQNLAPIVDRLLVAVPTAHLLVVDDASPDGTGALADRLAARDGRVCVLHRTEKAGLGAAYVAGFRWAQERGYDVVVEMDADGHLAWRAVQAGYRVVEVPITFVERVRGESKMSRAIVLEALWRDTWWGLRARRSHPRPVSTGSC